MASLAELVTAAAAIHGTSGAVNPSIAASTLQVLRIPYVVNLGGGNFSVTDGGPSVASVSVAGTPTYTATGGPCYEAGGSTPCPYVSFNGTTQGLDLGTVGSDTAAIDDGGLYCMFLIRHTSTAGKDRVMGSYNGAFQNGFDVCMNQTNLDGTSANYLTISQFDGAGGNSRTHWNLDGQDRILSQNAWACLEFYITKAAAPLAWFNGVQRLLTATNGALPSGSFTSGAQKTVIGGYGWGSNTTYDSIMDFCAAVLINGKPSDAQRLTLLTAMQYNARGIPGVRYHYKAANATASAVTPAEDGVVDSISNLNLDLEAVVQATAANKPTYMVTQNFGKPVVNFNNILQSGTFGAGTIRQSMAKTSIVGMNSSQVTMVGALRLTASQILGGTNYTLFSLLRGGTVYATLRAHGVSNGICRLVWDDGTSANFDASGLLDTFSGPGLVVWGASINRTGASGTMTLAMQNVSASAAGGPPRWNTAAIDQIQLGGATAGDLAAMWFHEGIVSDRFVDSTTLLAAMAAMFTEHASAGEVIAPTNHVTAFADSITVGQESHLNKGHLMRLPEKFRRNCSWRNVSVSGMSIGGTTNFTSITPNAANKGGGASVTNHTALVIGGTNDWAENGSITGAALATSLDTFLASLTRYDRKIVSGLLTNGPNSTQRADFLAAINSRVPATIKSTINYRDISAKLADSLHPNDAGHQQMAEDDDTGGAGSTGGGLSAAAPEFATRRGGIRSRSRTRR